MTMNDTDDLRSAWVTSNSMIDQSRSDAQCAFRTDTSQERRISTSTHLCRRSRGQVWTWRLVRKGLANVRRIGVPDLQSSYTIHTVLL